MNIVPFQQWSDRQLPNLPTFNLPSNETWLHHGAAGTSSVATLRSYLDHHVRRNGWLTIGYSFAIAEGRVYECRGAGRQGAHTAGRNRVAHGICMVGDHRSRPPSDADLHALVWLLRHGTDRRWWQHPQLTGGHRDAPRASTACPGDALHRLIPDINRRARTNVDEGDEMNEAQARQLDELAASVARIEKALTRQGRVGDDLGRLRRSVRAIGGKLGVPVAENMEPSGIIDA